MSLEGQLSTTFFLIAENGEFHVSFPHIHFLVYTIIKKGVLMYELNMGKYKAKKSLQSSSQGVHQVTSREGFTATLILRNMVQSIPEKAEVALYFLYTKDTQYSFHAICNLLRQNVTIKKSTPPDTIDLKVKLITPQCPQQAQASLLQLPQPGIFPCAISNNMLDKNLSKMSTSICALIVQKLPSKYSIMA